MKKHTRSAISGSLLLPLLLTQAGCHNVLGFSTATKFGLDISQRADQMIDVTMGYDRTEVASIPAPEKNGHPENEMEATGMPENKCTGEKVCSDTYSVLGTFEVDYGNPFLAKPIEIHQVFATGMAARVAANKSRFQEILGTKAGDFAKSKGNSDTQNQSQLAGEGK